MRFLTFGTGDLLAEGQACRGADNTEAGRLIFKPEKRLQARSKKLRISLKQVMIRRRLKNLKAKK
jgi:hypothetical protein